MTDTDVAATDDEHERVTYFLFACSIVYHAEQTSQLQRARLHSQQIYSDHPVEDSLAGTVLSAPQSQSKEIRTLARGND